MSFVFKGLHLGRQSRDNRKWKRRRGKVERRNTEERKGEEGKREKSRSRGRRRKPGGKTWKSKRGTGDPQPGRSEVCGKEDSSPQAHRILKMRGRGVAKSCVLAGHREGPRGQACCAETGGS